MTYAELVTIAAGEIHECQTLRELDQAKTRWLGRRGIMTLLCKTIGQAIKEAK